MNSSLRQHVTVIIAVALGVMIGSVGPSVAQAAYDAVNADKVDGKHAVGAGAGINARKGKLVATNPMTGRLPDNIIKRAGDSVRLGGYPHRAIRSLPLSIYGAHLAGGASATEYGVHLASAGNSALTVKFVVPPDHLTGSRMWVDVVYSEISSDACAVYLHTLGLYGPVSGQFVELGWKIPPLTSTFGGLMQVASGPDDVHKQVFEWPVGSSEPGQSVDFHLTRLGDEASDTCGEVRVTGLQLRY